MKTEIKLATNQQLKKSLTALSKSLKKLENRHAATDLSSDDALEIWESFAARFARSSDLFISKWLRLSLLEKDPGYQGSLIDSLHLAEKYGWIESSEVWARIRELRNIQTHEYAESDLAGFFETLRNLSPVILKLEIALSL